MIDSFVVLREKKFSLSSVVCSLIMVHLIFSLLFEDLYFKFNIVSGCTLHVFLFSFVLFFAVCNIITSRYFFKFHLVIIVFAINLLYFIVSAWLFKRDMYYVIRQSVIGFYPFVCMLFVFTLSSSSFDKISINKILSFLFCGNLILHIFYLLSKLIFFGEISSYSYYSHASLILLSGTGAYVVFMNKFSFKQILLFFGSIFCILATSHGSLLLAFFFSFVCAIIFKNNLKPFFGFYVLPFVFLPFFLFDSNLEYIITNIDENLFFRRVYWQQALESLASYKLLFFGHGLGVEYVDADFVQDLIYYFGHDNQLGNLHKRYTLSLHNSFLSFFYHYGLIVFLVIVNYFFFITFRFRNICYSKEKIGMALSVLGGFTVWCSFNVILELPYSSSFFWILFFYCCRALTYSSNSWFLPS